MKKLFLLAVFLIVIMGGVSGASADLAKDIDRAAKIIDEFNQIPEKNINNKN